MVKPPRLAIIASAERGVRGSQAANTLRKNDGMIAKLILGVLPGLLISTQAAWARALPSFDCAKASTKIEKTICGEEGLAQLDATMAAAFTALRAKLAGPAREHLVADQVRWVGAMAKACVGLFGEVGDCLNTRFNTRVERLKALSAGDYPFVGEQAVTRVIGPKATVTFDAAYPQFDLPGTDFGAVNRGYRDRTTKTLTEITPDQAAVAAAAADGQNLHYQQWFMIQRPTPTTVAVMLYSAGYLGGAHGTEGGEAALIDQRTGEILTPSTVFVAGPDWLKTMTGLVTTKLKEIAKEMECVEIPEPAALSKLLDDPKRYYFRDDLLEIAFQRGELGPYICPVPAVELDYAALKPILRATGPLGPRG